MNTQSLVPKGELTTEDTELMLALNRAVVSLIDDPRPIFQFTELNGGNRRLAAHLASNPLRIVEYEFGHMLDFDRQLWLNIHFTLNFHDVKPDWNNEDNTNFLFLTPKQTTEVLRRANSNVAISRLQTYAVSLTEEIAEAARQTAEAAKRRINPHLDDRDQLVLDQATGALLCGAYTSATLAAMRGLDLRRHVIRFGR